MDNFTKEELLALNVIVSVWNVKYTDDDKTISLYKKIQSMIESYCTHTETKIDADGGISLICSECGKTIVDVM